VNKKSLHVYIVDDEQKVRDSLSTFFSLHGFKVNTYADAESYLYELDQDEVGCLISDIDMEDMNGLQLQECLNEVGSIRPTIFITGHANIDVAIKAMKLGAVDFIEKPFDPDELVIKVIAAIEKFSDKMLISSCYRLLTKKEIEVFNLVARGDKNRSIAEKLFISIPTVEAHRSRVMKKMRAKSLPELVKMSVLLINGA
jgi:FixJ family two-component response regulator